MQTPFLPQREETKPAALIVGAEYPLAYSMEERGHHHSVIFLGRDPLIPDCNLFAYNYNKDHSSQLMLIPAKDCLLENGKIVDRTTRYTTLPITAQPQVMTQRESLLIDALYEYASHLNATGGSR